MNETTEKFSVIGVFDSHGTAQAAARELIDEGIPREDVQVQTNLATTAAGRSVEDAGERREEEGGIRGFFHRLFHSDEDSSHYSEAVRRGSTVVVARVPSQLRDRAVDILNSHGAVDIDRRVANYREQGWQGYDPNAPAYTAEEAERERAGSREMSGERTIPVVEEEIAIGKRMVRRGGVRVYTETVEEPVQEQITLQEEHVRVHRRPVDRQTTPADAAKLEGQSIEVVETSEEPVISKRTRVKEEVVVGKEVTSRTEQVSDKVRKTKVNVEEIADPDESRNRE
jgi:uncharacterized protein (TIGR02271 family)